MSRGTEFVYPVLEQTPTGVISTHEAKGMTIREHFAGLALQGLVAGYSLNHDEAARKAVLFADALIRALEKDPT